MLKRRSSRYLRTGLVLLLACGQIAMSAVGKPIAMSAVGKPIAKISMYSDAQCPCSAQFVSDIKHILSFFQYPH